MDSEDQRRGVKALLVKLLNAAFTEGELEVLAAGEFAGADVQRGV